MTRWRMWCVQTTKGVKEFRVYETEGQAQGYCAEMKKVWGSAASFWWEL